MDKKTEKKFNTNCCVPGCTSRKGKCPTLSFHYFPLEKTKNGPIRRKQWHAALKIGKPISAFMQVCSRHFTKTDFFLSDYPAKKPRLQKHAVPSQNLPLSSVDNPVLVRKRKVSSCLRKSRYDVILNNQNKTTLEDETASCSCIEMSAVRMDIEKKANICNINCCVPGCTSRKGKCPELSFHYFPSEKSENGDNRRKEWKRVLKIGKPISKYMQVCSKHFEKSDFFLPGYPTKKRILKRGTVPSQNLPLTYSLMKRKRRSIVLQKERLKKIKQKENAKRNSNMKQCQRKRYPHQLYKSQNHVPSQSFNVLLFPDCDQDAFSGIEQHNLTFGECEAYFVEQKSVLQHCQDYSVATSQYLFDNAIFTASAPVITKRIRRLASGITKPSFRSFIENLKNQSHAIVNGSMEESKRKSSEPGTNEESECLPRVLKKIKEEPMNVEELMRISYPLLFENLPTCLKMLKIDYGADVYFLSEGDFLSYLEDRFDYPIHFDQLKGILFQTREMKNSMSYYPEYLCIDKTQKLCLYEFPLYLLTIEDSNGQSQIIGVSIHFDDNPSTLRLMLEKFKALTPSCENLQCIMGGKVLLEREVLTSVFPTVPLLMCRFYTLRRLRTEVTTKKFDITWDEREESLQLLQKVVYSKDDDSFQSAIETFKIEAPLCVVEYFTKQWLVNEDEWWLGGNLVKFHFISQTHNRLGYFTSHLKQFIQPNTPLPKLVQKFFEVLNNHSVAQRLKITSSLLAVYQDNRAETRYMRLLTTYATKFLMLEMEHAKKLCFESKAKEKFMILSPEGLLEATETDCTCCFKSLMRLPCRHIFYIRSKKGLDLFDTSLCHERWTKSYFQKSKYYQLLEEEDESESAFSKVDCVLTSSQRTYEEKQKLFQSFVNIQENLVCNTKGVDFDKKIGILKEIMQAWSEGKEIEIEPCSDVPLESMIDVDYETC